MAIATDTQMQSYADNRIRVIADWLQSIVHQITNDKAVIGDEYARANSATAWADARTDGPPHLLQSGNSANPDDLLNYNAFITALLNLINGTSVANGSTVAADAATLASSWVVLQRAQKKSFLTT